MSSIHAGRARRAAVAAAVALALGAVPARGELECSAARPEPLLPRDPARCAALAEGIRHPAALPLDRYEELLGEFLRDFCHRDAAHGWKRDKGVRDTGPFTATLEDGAWVGRYHGTHAPVVIWYSPEMIDWLHANRPVDAPPPAAPEPIPDGAVMVKEMYPAPAAACAGVDPTHLLPTSGAAVMVRDRQASQDGWFWGWFGWSGWDPDWPAGPPNRYPYMGFGQYCTNCHASAEADFTFASLVNVEGEPGRPLVFLSQHFFTPKAIPSHHRLVSLPGDDAERLGSPRVVADPAVAALASGRQPAPGRETVEALPSETYDNVWAHAGALTAASQFVTSDQCIGCHDAGGTGLQFDMTAPDPQSGDLLLNLSPYATWRTSPMGLGGRDPIFYAQLASETQTFHPTISPVVQDTCLGCHGVTGQRQFHVDGVRPLAAHRRGGGAGAGDDCTPFLREVADAVPWPDDDPGARLAAYGALARDGISCTACHHMLVGEGDGPALDRPENRCVRERQEFLNPGARGFARTFTGSFLVGPPEELYGPFAAPKVKPMENALGITAVESAAVRSSELCGSCHTVHLPVFTRAGERLGEVYEQTTYPEWAFSSYRVGTTPQGPLPFGAGERAQSCQGCHMPSADAAGTPYRSKIAGIQEHSSFPQAEHALPAADIDLEVRDAYARHTLVGLNLFFVKMAQQFPDVLGIRTQDPMLVSLGLDPLLWTERAMLDQAAATTAEVEVGEIRRAGGRLRVPVTVTSRVGHKFPSGVGFRRAFLRLEVLDGRGAVVWASGRSDGAGVLVDAAGRPLPGELWWMPDCSARLHPDELVFQPHHQVIERQDQAQVYQELVTAPPPGRHPECGVDVPARPPLTTSFLSICTKAKDNRILPHGTLPEADRAAIAAALGAGPDLAAEAGAFGVGDDPDYVTGGGDSLVYAVDLAELPAPPAAVRATLFYQATPPFFLQDRFCTARGPDTGRLQFLAGHVDLAGTAAEGWKLELVSTGEVPVPPT